jgi:hypothetical protein
MLGYWELFSRVYLQGLSRENSLLVETQSKAAHGRLINEYGTTGLLAMLVKTITMGFVAMLGSFRLYFELEVAEAAAAAADGSVGITEPKFFPHASFLETWISNPHAGLRAGKMTPCKWQYYLYASLLMLSTLFIFVAMMTSVGNYLALSLIDDRGLKNYLRQVGVVADLPFLSLIWGVTMWHIALIVLMFYIVDTAFGAIFCVACLFSIWLISYGMGSMLSAVDGALESSKADLLKHPYGNDKQYKAVEEEENQGASMLGLM